MKYIKKYINEDYISDYDSDSNDLESLDDISKKVNEEYVIKELKELYTSMFRVDNKPLFRIKNDILSLLDDNHFTRYEIACICGNEHVPSSLVIGETIRVLAGIYLCIEYAVSHYKQYDQFDTAKNIINYIQIDFEYKHKTFVNKVKSSDVWLKLGKNMASNYIRLIEDYFLNPIQSKLDELKKWL